MLLGVAVGQAHDIPNARIERSIQVILEPLRLEVDYRVSLAELTLIQDLRQLDDGTFVGDRVALFDHYARLIGPLNARGLVTRVDAVEVDLVPVGFEVTVDDHPSFRFRYQAPLPSVGRLTLIDSNYASAEGSVRLGLRVSPAVSTVGDLPPADVESIATAPAWSRTPGELRRIGRLDVTFRPRAIAPSGLVPAAPGRAPAGNLTSDAASGLSRLLDRSSGRNRAGWIVAALMLGMMHALQPGHGKTLIAAAHLGTPDAARRGILLGIVTATCHLVGVVVVAAVLWCSRVDRYAAIDQTILRVAGFQIAAVGAFRIGRHLAGLDAGHLGVVAGRSGLWSIGIAAGFVPCWDAVALVAVAHSVGQLGWGLVLLVAFSAGLAIVLVGVGWSIGFLGDRSAWGRRWGPARRGFGLVSGLALAAIGLGLMGR